MPYWRWSCPPTNYGTYPGYGEVRWSITQVHGTAIWPSGTACTFEVGRVAWTTDIGGDSSRRRDVTRIGLTTQPGCPRQVAAGLPRRLRLQGDDLVGDGFMTANYRLPIYHLGPPTVLQSSVTRAPIPSQPGCQSSYEYRDIITRYDVLP